MFLKNVRTANAFPTALVLLAGLVLIMPALTGCSKKKKRPKVYACEVDGVITIDGRRWGDVLPNDARLKLGTMCFVPETTEETGGRPGVSLIDADGRFRVGNANPAKPAGLKPGKYAITVLVMKAGPDGAQTLHPALPSQYGDYQQTPFHITVKPGKHHFKFDIKTSDQWAQKPTTIQR